MCSNCDYTIHGRHFHYGWNRDNPPAERVAPGSTVFFECHDSSGGQLTAGSTLADVSTLDFGKINPVTGPIFVEGAEPGDALKVTIEEFKPSGFGWTANIPGFGLLADQFKEPALQLWTYDPASLQPAAFGKHGCVPLKPFAGTIGCAPAEPGQHSVVPPRRVAAQGDGEVCGTAIESPMNVVLKLDLVKDARLKTPRFTTPGPVTRHLDAKGYEVTTGVGPDLMEGARAAVADMIELLAARYNIAPIDAYMLVSTCGDLRISEIVDMPNWVVSFYFPRCVFE